MAVCQDLVRFYDIINYESMFLSPPAQVEISQVGRRLATIYASLAQSSLAVGLKTWKIMPMLYTFVHLCEWQAVEVGNPRFYWTYVDEDLVGLLVEVAESCHARTVAPSAMFKWLHVYYE